MLLLVGLGNIGERYQFTRHNIGFLLIDYIASYYQILGFKNNFKSQVAETRINNQKILLQKPSTFMNLSGDALVAISKFYKIPNDNIIIFQDDIDLNLQDIRYKTKSGDGGQKGIRDIQNKIGKDIHRIKLGIGKPIRDTSGYVLSNFKKDELHSIGSLFEKIACNLELLINKDFNNFIQKVKEN